jgi:hypothetical protein
VLTATVTHAVNGNTATFTPVSDTEVDGFEMEVEEFNTDTIWSVGNPPTGINSGSLGTISYDYPSAKTLHYKYVTPDDPYNAGVNMLLENTFLTAANITVGLNFRFRSLGTPHPPPATVPFFTQYNEVFTVIGISVTAQGVKTYFGTGTGLVQIYNGWTPNVYGIRTYEAWATIIDAIGERLIKLGTSTLFDVCAI